MLRTAPATRLDRLGPFEPVALCDPMFLVDASPSTHSGQAALPLQADPYPYPLRLGILLVCATIRFAGQSGICSALTVDNASSPYAMLEPLLVMVTLEDGQGLLSFLLFGLQAAHMKLLRSCLVTSNATSSMCSRTALSVSRVPARYNAKKPVSVSVIRVMVCA